MAFHKITGGARDTLGRPPLNRTVRAAVLAAGSSAVARFTISEDVHKALGSPAYCQVFIGTGSDAGRIAIKPCATAKAKTHTLCAQNKGRRRLVAMNVSRLGIPAQPRPTFDIPFNVTDDGLIVDIRPLMKPVAVDLANAA